MTHEPVLLKESTDALEIRPGDIVVDATLGQGGHSAEICRRHAGQVRIIGIDLDEEAIKKSQAKLESLGCQASFKTANFRDLGKILDGFSIDKADRILADLGFSSVQLEESGRGFSFQKDEPLVMTLKKNPGPEDITAGEIVNSWQEENIAQILWGYGEERYGRKIARAIAEARTRKKIETTGELVEIVRQAVPKSYQKMKTHFATRTFQALRIAANDELRALADFLQIGFERLSSGGRMAVISFHSLEDRIVKRFFKEKQKDKSGKIINKKPITPTKEELQKNKRSRSAKLRIIEKI